MERTRFFQNKNGSGQDKRTKHHEKQSWSGLSQLCNEMKQIPKAPWGGVGEWKWGGAGALCWAGW